MKPIFTFILTLAPLFCVAQTVSYTKTRLSIPENSSDLAIQKILRTHYPTIFEDANYGIQMQYRNQSLGGNHVFYNQTYKGLPIYQKFIKANISHDNILISTMHDCMTGERTESWGNTISMEETRAKLTAETQSYQTDISAWWYPQGGVLLPCYVAHTFATTLPSSYEWVVDAQTGIIFQQTERDAYLHRNMGDTTGKGAIFSPDPVTASGSVYGSPYADNADQHSPAFFSVMDTVDLLDITYTGNKFHLEGPYVKIENVEPNDSIPVTSLSGNFYFTRNRSGFEDVMVYYYIDKYQRYIRSLGFTQLYNFPIRADAHGFGNQDNSHFVPNGAMSYLGFGQGGVDDGEDPDVVLHEYGHGLSYAASPNSNTGTERRGLDEGIGDYIAAGHSYDMNPYLWSSIFTWDGHNPYWGGRNAATPNLYPTTGGIYTVGEVWASTLMQIRLALGSQTADKLFLEELYHNVPNMTLPDAAKAYLDADTLLYGGIHTPTILQYFCARGILSGSSCTGVAIHQPYGHNNVFSYYPTPTQDNLHITLKTPTSCTLIIYDLQGRICLQKTLEGETHMIPLSLPAGIYLLEIQEENTGLRAREKLWIGE